VVWGTALAVFVVRLTAHGAAIGAIARVVPIASTVVVFIIGYFQLGQIELAPTPPVAAAEAPAPPVAAAEAPAPPAPPPVPYQRARLPDDDAAELEARLRAAMTDDHLYTRPGLTLAELADAVAATPHEVSQILSVRLQCNFYAFVNEHRVAHAKAALADPARRDVSVLDLAFEAGFRSKSTFNSAFRKATGVTPTAFRERGATAAGAA
jgi:AraC-like DNA-binding protein